MSKLHYFSKKISKIAKCWGLSDSSTPKPFILVTWSCVIWPNCCFSNRLQQNRN